MVTLTVDGGSLSVREDVNIVNYGELKMLSGSIDFLKNKGMPVLVWVILLRKSH